GTWLPPSVQPCFSSESKPIRKDELMRAGFRPWIREHLLSPRGLVQLVTGVISLVVLLSLLGHGPRSSTATGTGRGAGGAAQVGAVAQDTNPCLTGDVGQCLSQSIFSWIATNIQQTIEPVTDGVLTNPVDIIYQTPAQDTYDFEAVKRINMALVVVVDAALATLVLIGGLNLMIGPHINMPNASGMELLARLVLVVGLVHFNLSFLGQFIELNNALCLEIEHIAGITELANILASIFTNPAATVLTFVLMIVISLFFLWLLVQMIVRIGLVAVCLATAPLGLACLLLPQTLRWGRLWLTTFASSVMVQLVQVTALSLGGVLMTQLATTSFVRIDKGIATALLIIGVLFLVLKIPMMMQQWALYPMVQMGKGFKGGASKGGNGGGGTGGSGGSGGGSNGSGDSSGNGGSGSGGGGSFLDLDLDDTASMPFIDTMGADVLAGSFII
ncbi:MAG TPA: hypothetical protein VHD63_13310, partial [Ktedonobacteraceae bacterium]|nr:hypothetical protein [Ktedonobacteraceae bacterium]